MFKNKIFLPFLIGIIGGVILFLSTPWGAGLSPDSIVYLRFMRGIQEGKAVFWPGVGASEFLIKNHFAPLYPAILSIFAFLGDGIYVSKYLNIIIYILNIALAGYYVNASYGKNYALGFIVSLTALFSDIFMTLHSMAYSEPLFILFAFGGFFLLAGYIKTGRLWELIFSALLLSLAMLTRFAGLPLLASSVLALVLMKSENFKKCFGSIAIFTVIALTPLILWLIRNFILFGSLTSRSFNVHFIGLKHFEQAFDTFWFWFIPLKSENLIPLWFKILISAVLVLFFLCAILYFIWNNAGKKFLNLKKFLSEIPELMRILVIFIPIYCAFLSVSISFFDAHTNLDYRIFGPVYYALIILVPFAVYRLAYVDRGKTCRVVCMSIATLFLATYAVRGVYRACHTYKNGQGFSAKVWHESKIIEKLKTQADNFLVFSNGFDIIELLSERECGIPPASYYPGTLVANPSYEEQLNEMKAKLKKSGGCYIYFTSFQRPYFPSEDDLNANSSIRVETCPLGKILFFENEVTP